MRQQILVGTVTAALGLLVMVLAMGWLPVPDASVHAPRWVIFTCGLMFLLAGMAVLLPATGAAWAASETLKRLLAALIITCFAAVFCWVGFGPGERSFSASSGSAGGVSVAVHGPANETLGRVVFGGMGALMAVWAAVAWYGLFNVLAEHMRSNRGVR